MTNSLSFSLNQILSPILYLFPTITIWSDNYNKPARINYDDYKEQSRAGRVAATARQRGASALILVGAEPSYDETEEREERSQPACQVMIPAQPQPGPSLAWPASRH